VIEAELKAEITSLDFFELKSKLLDLCKQPKQQIYWDIYFTKDSEFETSEQELRLRTIYTDKLPEKHIITYKTKPLDSESKSKEETETEISNADKMQEILLSLGFHVKIKFQKICENYNYQLLGQNFLITLVSFTEFNDKFIEIEVLTSNQIDLISRLSEIKQILTSLDIPEHLITNEYYTDFFLKKSKEKNSK